MPLGPSILDFAAVAVRLAVEIDGERHHVGDGARRDATGDAFLTAQGWRVLGVLNADVLDNMDGVDSVIADAVGMVPHPGSLSGGGGEGR